MRRGWAFVTQPESDDGDVDPRLQKMHRRGMTDRMRGYRTLRELRVTLSGGRNDKLEALRDIRARNPFSASAWKQEPVTACTLEPALPARINDAIERQSGTLRSLRPLS